MKGPKKVIWEGNSREWPDTRTPSLTYPKWRAVYDGKELIFEKSSGKDAMDNEIWEKRINWVPTQFLEDYARKLYETKQPW